MGGKYRRVLIKISGEALSGGKGTGYDIAFVTEVCESVKRCLKMGVQVGIVIKTVPARLSVSARTAWVCLPLR